MRAAVGRKRKRTDADRAAGSRLTPAERAVALASVEALVWNLAHRLHKASPWSDVEDIAAEVRLGFVRAACEFDPDRGFRFTTYCYRAGWQAGCEFLTHDTARGLRVPRNYKVDRPDVFRQGDAPDAESGDAVLGTAPARAAALQLPPDFWERVTRRLGRREADAIILRYRYGFKLHQISRYLGVSKERVRQIAAAAVRRLGQDEDLADQFRHLTT